jgi:hypothetical protein
MVFVMTILYVSCNRCLFIIYTLHLSLGVRINRTIHSRLKHPMLGANCNRTLSLDAHRLGTPIVIKLPAHYLDTTLLCLIIIILSLADVTRLALGINCNCYSLLEALCHVVGADSVYPSPLSLLTARWKTLAVRSLTQLLFFSML